MHLRSVNIEGLGVFSCLPKVKVKPRIQVVDRMTMMKHRTRQYNGKVR